MKINLVDYPPGCGKTLTLQHSPFRMLRGALIFSGLAYATWFRGGHHTILIFLLSAIAGIFYIIAGILLVDPIVGGVSMNENGIESYSILKKRWQFKWVDMRDIQLKYLGNSERIPMLAFKANGNKDYAIYISFKEIEDKKEFVELVKQWQQYYCGTIK